jgi:hypothetical protein
MPTRDSDRHEWMLGAAAGIGALVGIIAMLFASSLLTGDSAAMETTTTSTTAPVPEWFHPAEVILGPAILVPETVRFEPGAVSLRYRLEPITPSAVGPDDRVDTTVLPDRWTLTTSSGVVTASTDPWTRLVVFRLADGTTADQIEGLRLDGYWIRSPFYTVVSVSPAESPVAEVAQGVSLEIVRTISSAAGSQVVAALASGDPFTVSDLTVEGASGDWVTSSVDQTGSGRWTLSFSTPEPPDPLALAVRGVLWVPIDADIAIDLDGVPRG